MAGTDAYKRHGRILLTKKELTSEIRRRQSIKGKTQTKATVLMSRKRASLVGSLSRLGGSATKPKTSRAKASKKRVKAGSRNANHDAYIRRGKVQLKKSELATEIRKRQKAKRQTQTPVKKLMAMKRPSMVSKLNGLGGSSRKPKSKSVKRAYSSTKKKHTKAKAKSSGGKRKTTKRKKPAKKGRKATAAQKRKIIRKAKAIHKRKNQKWGTSLKQAWAQWKRGTI